MAYRRGYNWEVQEYFTAPTGGWNPDAPAELMNENQAMVLDNFIVRPGKIVTRGSFSVRADYSAVTPLNTAGYVLGDPSWILLARKTPSATAYIDPWNAHLARPATSTRLAAGNTTGRWSSAPGALSTVVLTADQIPGPRWVVFNGMLSGIGYDSASAVIQDTNSNYYAKSTKLLSLPMTQTVATAPTAYANGPQGAVDLKGYLSRMWVLGGTPATGTGAFSTTTLYFTNPITAFADASSQWYDPVNTSIPNNVVIDNNTNDPGIALAVNRAGLLVFRRWSTWILRGTTPRSFTMTSVSREAGCIDARSVCETDRGTYFLSHKGLYMTDGLSARMMSGTASNTLQNALGVLEQAQVTSSGGWGTVALTADGMLFVSIGIYEQGASPPNPTGKQLPVWNGLFDPSIGVWVRITSALWSGDSARVGAPNYPGLLVNRGGVSNKVYSIGDKYVTQVEDTTQAVSISRNASLYDNLTNGTFAPIDANWISRQGHVANNNRKKAQMKRMFIDYAFQGAGLPTAGWTVSAVDASLNALTGTPFTTATISAANTSSVLGTGNPSALPTVQHQSQDVVPEVVDVGVQARWIDQVRVTLPTSVVPEIHGIGIEFQPSSDRR